MSLHTLRQANSKRVVKGIDRASRPNVQSTQYAAHLPENEVLAVWIIVRPGSSLRSLALDQISQRELFFLDRHRHDTPDGVSRHFIPSTLSVSTLALPMNTGLYSWILLISLFPMSLIETQIFIKLVYSFSSTNMSSFYDLKHNNRLH